MGSGPVIPARVKVISGYGAGVIAIGFVVLLVTTGENWRFHTLISLAAGLAG